MADQYEREERKYRIKPSRLEYGERVRNPNITLDTSVFYSETIQGLADRLKQSVEERVSEYPTSLFAPLLSEALSPLINFGMSMNLGIYEKALKGCESYLEQLMLIGLLTVARHRALKLMLFDRNQDCINQSELVATSLYEQGDEMTNSPIYILAIQPQVTVAEGDMDRVDFTLLKSGPVDEKAGGLMTLQFVTRSSRFAQFNMPHSVVAIECDGIGHDQEADKKRDGIWLDNRQVPTSRHSSEEIRGNYLERASIAFRMLEEEYSKQFDG